MPSMFLREGDWLPDLPDHRDLLPASNSIRRLLRRLRSGLHECCPKSVDWREYFSPVVEQGEFATSVAHSGVALVQYFERRATGRLLKPSRAFLDKNARRLAAAGSGQGGASLRQAMKAIVRFGLPPERLWPYGEGSLSAEPPAFAYSYAREFAKIRYCRLDPSGESRQVVLERMRRFLAAGFCFAIGFPLVASAGESAEIPFPSLHDSVGAGQAVVALGYDDQRRIRSNKGALLIRNSWGRQWGEDGYGWLPYSYVLRGLAIDAWTLLERRWLRSGEFSLPERMADD